MTDTAIVGRNIEVVQANTVASTPFSWSAAIAGAIAATAVTFIVISLGSGIGLSLASPYRISPSATTLTIAGAVWLVMAQAFGFAAGGYLSARLRLPLGEAFNDETTFRDAAQGFLVWALGVVVAVLIAAVAAASALGTVAQVGATLGAGAATGTGIAASSVASNDQTSYVVDSLFRTAPGGATTTGTDGSGQYRAEAGRILVTSAAQGRLADEDKAYLGRIVAARTGMTPEEATKRVDETITTMQARAKEAADKAAKGAAMASFWTFMSLLIGAAAAVLGGIVGGQLRDEDSRLVRRS